MHDEGTSLVLFDFGTLDCLVFCRWGDGDLTGLIGDDLFMWLILKQKLKSLLLVNTVDDSSKGTKCFGVHSLFGYVQW